MRESAVRRPELQERHGIGRIGGMAQHTRTADVHMGAPVILVGQDDIDRGCHRTVRRVVGAGQAGEVVGVGHTDAAFAGSNSADLARIVRFRFTRHVRDQALNPCGGGLFAVGSDQGANQ